MSSVLGLPPMSPELKSIAPYLQRADELQAREPVMAYWCAYYAAQIGISLKVKSKPARDLLFELLTVLERMKEELGPSDAVNIESVSSAYVENFALKIFGTADNEDRKGEANRSTAKKFLAAANFLEVLKIFPNTPITESSEEKIKYAKWKAADIAKAFREGRKPTPGPAGSGLEHDSPPAGGTSITSSSPPLSGTSLSTNGEGSGAASGTGKQSTPSPTSSSGSGKISPKRTSPPPSMNAADIARANLSPREFQPKTPQRPGANTIEDTSSPGSWSTAATPGTDDRTSRSLNGFEYGEQDTPTRKKETGRATSRLRTAWVSGELEDTEDVNGDDGDSPQLKRTVRFTPSVTGGLTPPVTPPVSSGSDGTTHKHFAPVQPDSRPSLPTPSSSRHPPGAGHTRQSSTSSLSNSPPKRNRTTSLSSSPPRPTNFPSAPPSVSTTPTAQPSAPPLSYATPTPVYASASVHLPHSAAPQVPSPPLELTSQVIAKAQKHCRFAISALDYEDADQARKELRAALAALGG